MDTRAHRHLRRGGSGGGPAGHPRIFINTDKPEIMRVQLLRATICRANSPSDLASPHANRQQLPQANEHHRKHLESFPEKSYPLQ